MKFLGEGECKRKKHGAEYRREWRKVHLGIDAQTLEIRAIEVTSNAIGDADFRSCPSYLRGYHLKLPRCSHEVRRLGPELLAEHRREGSRIVIAQLKRHRRHRIAGSQSGHGKQKAGLASPL